MIALPQPPPPIPSTSRSTPSLKRDSSALEEEDEDTGTLPTHVRRLDPNLLSAKNFNVLSNLPATSDGLVVVKPDFRHLQFGIEEWIKNDGGVRLDTDSQICPANLSPSGCPLGRSCPLRHTTPSPLNYKPEIHQPLISQNGQFLPQAVHAKTVCKHWLRGLCKKGANCEFMHEYNLRKMPECWFFAKYNWCQNGDECMYLHVKPEERKPSCRDYEGGFCRKGPDCEKLHIQRVACPFYLVGFCPHGLTCRFGHPTFEPRPADHHHPFHDPPGSNPQTLPNPTLPPHFRDGGGPGDRGVGYGARDGDDDGKGGRRMMKKNLDEVVCFKCGQRGHYANLCFNPPVPGQRGGVERGPGGRPLNPSEL